MKTRRIIERRRAELAQGVRNARKEFQKGDYQAATPGELMEEI